MNQILQVKDNKTKKISKLFFKIQLIVSILSIFVLLFFIANTIISIHDEEKKSNTLINNYNIYQLYKTSAVVKKKDHKSNIFGTIEISKINLTYPILENISDENLKLLPCKFFGPELNEVGNICIAGHNYDNGKFFSNLFLLNTNDIIFITDNYGKKYKYAIFKIYEVKENDLSPIYNYKNNSKELTLLTCDNKTKNRVIVKATLIN